MPWLSRQSGANGALGPASQGRSYNAVENLVLFAPLVLAVEMLGINGPATAASSVVFFLARLVHALSYTLAVPWVRTLAFAVGWASVICLVWQLLTS